ncbi:MAG TPA: ATP-binding protein [Magnetospirillum sp.]|nr:ATP-binding protein [Magnetospirillum sp.]
MAGPLQRSLRLRLIAACVVIETLMLALIIGNNVRLIGRHLGDLATTHLHHVEETAALMLAPPLAAGDHRALEGLVQRLSGLDGVVYLALTDAKDALVAGAGQVPSPLPEPDGSFSDARPVHHAQSELVLAGQPVGRLHVGLSTGFLHAARQDVLAQGIAIAALEIFLSTFAVVTIGVVQASRLKALGGACLRFAGGDYRTSVDVHGDDEVGVLARSFNTMGAAVGARLDKLEARGAMLRASNAELQRLAELTAQHLQEPIRGLADFAQLLSTRVRDRLDGETLDYLDSVVTAAQRARGLLTDLQNYIAIDMTPLAADAVADLAQCAEKARAELRARIDASGAAITIAPLPRVHGDGDQITTVLRMLMVNAIDHRGEAPPAIHVKAMTDEGRVIVSVTDNGPGVPSEFRERIFELFETLGRPTTGTGMGLAAVRKIVRRHLGNVWITPAVDGGLTVNFTLPRIC